MRDRVFIIVRSVVVVALAALTTILALPSPMRSTAWDPPRAPNLEGPFARNELLQSADRLAAGQIVGPEGIAIDAAGRVYAGTLDGKIVRVRPGSPVEVFTETGGRPLGMRFGPPHQGGARGGAGNGDLYVADAMKGLLRVDEGGNIEVLAREAEGTPLTYPNDVAPSADGRTLYVTDSSQKWGYGDQVNDILEAVPSGRLIRFDLVTRDATVLVRNLAFANGIALSADESFLLVSEMGRHRITRVWLQGDRRHLAETFIDNLPGFPDNISASPRGTWWVALYSIRKPLLDAVHPYPFLKDCLAALPEALRPHAAPYGLVFEVDARGRVLRSLHDPEGARLHGVTSVVEHRGELFLGSLSATHIGRVPLPEGGLP